MPLFAIPTAVEGHLSTMPRPDPAALRAEMSTVRAAGVTVLISLLTPAEQARLGLDGEPAAAADAGLEFRSFPIRDFSVPSLVALSALADEFAERLRAGENVAVHCRGGIGRSSLVAAAFLVRLGTPVERAWTDISAARGRRVPETRGQRRCLDAFARSSAPDGNRGGRLRALWRRFVAIRS